MISSDAAASAAFSRWILAASRLQRLLLHLLLLELQRVAHLLGRPAPRPAAPPGRSRYFSGRSTWPRNSDAQHDAVLGQQRPQLLLDVLLNLDALVGEDLAHRVLGQRPVQHAVDHRLDQLLADVGRQPLGDVGDAIAIERIANGRPTRRPTAPRRSGRARRPRRWRCPPACRSDRAAGSAAARAAAAAPSPAPRSSDRDAAGQTVDAHAHLARRDDAHRRPQHQQQRRPEQRAHREQAAAARAAEGLDHAEHDGGAPRRARTT